MNVLVAWTAVVTWLSVLIQLEALNVPVYLVTKAMVAFVQVGSHDYNFLEYILTINSSDIDECASDTDNCDVNAGCINTGGSFQCVCRSGFQGSGQVCTGM